MTNPDYRAMCAELLAALESEGYAHWSIPPDEDELCLRARALLAEPVAEGPSDEELLASVRHFYGDQTAADMGAEDDLRTARAVLARWGRPAAAPVPEPGEVARCLADSLASFRLTQDPNIYPADHWSRRAATLLQQLSAPANSLPTPEATND
jgi:hypothetical protein